MPVPFSNSSPTSRLLHLHPGQKSRKGGPAVAADELGSIVSVAIVCSAEVQDGQLKQDLAQLLVSLAMDDMYTKAHRFLSARTFALGTSNKQFGQKYEAISMATHWSHRIESHSSQKNSEGRGEKEEEDDGYEGGYGG